MAFSSIRNTPSFASSLKKPTCAHSRSVFLGQRAGSSSCFEFPPRSAYVKLKSKTRRRYSVGPLNVVNEKVVGIHLGTTNSAIAVMEGGKPRIIPNAEGQRTTPSVVAYTKNGDLLVGQLAKQQAVVNPDNTFFSVKRSIGTPRKLGCPAMGKRFKREEISSQVLRKLVDDASQFLDDKVTKAVITVPAHFEYPQRIATRDAGRIAGLEVLGIINEPTAAALAFSFGKKNKETIMVSDLGGGGFDVSVLDVGDGVIEVLSSSGDGYLGGDDFDQEIVDWLASNFYNEGIKLWRDKHALQRLTHIAEKAKMELSSLTQTNISVPFITTTAIGPKHIETTLTRSKFEKLCSHLLRRLKTLVKKSMKDAKLSFKDIDEVILVGGLTRMPAVQELVKKMTGKDPNDVFVNPNEVVALGAAIHAGVLAGDVRDIVVKDVTSHSLGIETVDGEMIEIIPPNITLPTSKSKVFSTTYDGQTSVEINVLERNVLERRKWNNSLGCFRLNGIPFAPPGIRQIDVKFDIDTNGILSVTAMDKGSGKKRVITITGASTLPSDKVAKNDIMD